MLSAVTLLVGCTADEPADSPDALANPHIAALASPAGDELRTTTSLLVGDRVITGAEECDDGNSGPGDGCDTAGQVEDGYVCFTLGGP